MDVKKVRAAAARPGNFACAATAGARLRLTRAPTPAAQMSKRRASSAPLRLGDTPAGDDEIELVGEKPSALSVVSLYAHAARAPPSPHRTPSLAPPQPGKNPFKCARPAAKPAAAAAVAQPPCAYHACTCPDVGAAGCTSSQRQHALAVPALPSLPLFQGGGGGGGGGRRSTMQHFAEQPDALKPVLLDVRCRLLAWMSAPPDPCDPWAWMLLPPDPAPGATAHMLECAYGALSPEAVRYFVRTNRDLLTPAMFAGIFEGGYWTSGPTNVAMLAVKALPAGSRAVAVGACNGQWMGGVPPGVRFDMLDLAPMGGSVQNHPCDGSPFAPEGSCDLVIQACALPSPLHQPPTLRATVLTLRGGGAFVATDWQGRTSATMDAAYKYFQEYERRGYGSVTRQAVDVKAKRPVDMITFVRGGGGGGGAGAGAGVTGDVPLLKPLKYKLLEQHVTVPAGFPRDALPPVHSGGAVPVHAYLQLVATATSRLRRPGGYLITPLTEGGDVAGSSYGGGAGDVGARTTEQASGTQSANRSIKAFVSTLHKDDKIEERLAACLLFGTDEYHRTKVLQCCGGAPPTVEVIQFLTHVAEQRMLHELKQEERAGRIKITNAHISGFSQGFEAHAAENGACSAGRPQHLPACCHTQWQP